ncbi:ABC-2 type transport system ATP-binding protein [Alkalibaculum bacchi]|uniref:ABC-2 type transport system ATP-binding protein n=1 Tax=Alkalibaculum bacchi TaxID=645887 RepID=A0A366IFN9_9FIRM|nr:ABC transporter ATP-binding protein [Alkalibaculum bacchi]RBP70156.1 ABC-2 type transport system ATP-binding protein [Alkalibaculum bacchi]
MLSVKNVKKSFNGGKTFAVDDISFDVHSSEIFGFLGPNGAGKTTTIKMITGLLQLDSGSIEINGVDIQKDPIEAKRQFSFVPDSPEVFDKLKGVEYLNFLGDVYGVESKKRIERIEKYATLFELKHALNDPMMSYSHGMKQKIVLIGALLHEPEIFVLDEPMVGLDPKSAFHLKEIMNEHCQKGKSVFFSTHVLEVAEKICNRVAIINKGKIIAQGTIEELKNMTKNNESLENIFLELTEE